MKPCRLLICLLIGTFVLAAGQTSVAQQPSPRDELLALVPADAGFCLIVQQLRDQAQRWERSPWIKSLRASPLGKALENTPEVQRLTRLDGELQKRFKLSWANLRDDILGDAVVFAYWPAPPGQPDREQGMLLVRARSADVLKRFVASLNDEQKKSKELKELTDREHRGVKYQRRVDQKAEHFLLIDGNVLVFTSREDLMRKLIEKKTEDRKQRTEDRGQKTEDRSIVRQVTRAGVERAWAILWVNPRAFEAELKKRPQTQMFLDYWRPLDAIVLSLAGTEEVDLRMTIQARVDELPPATRKLFVETARPSELWQRFPAGAVVSVADRIDVARLAESIGSLLPAENRKQTLDALKKALEPAIKADLVKDVMPNIGPDWGVTVFAADDPKQFPHVLAALAVKPGAGDVKVDQALMDGLNFFATLAVYSSPKPLAHKVVRQETVEVHYLEGDKALPPGLQPAWALKDGYLAVASSPQALLQFHTRGPTASPPAAETPLVKLSATELARLLHAHRGEVIDYLAQKSNLPRPAVHQTFDSALGVLDLIDQITFAQSSGNGQIAWTLHLKPRVP